MLTKRDRSEKYDAIEGLRKLRHLNLTNLCNVMCDGNKAAFGRLVGQSSALIGQLIGPTPTRSIGEVLARDIERCLRLKSGYLDEAH
jgi:hypothetical protein